MSTSLAFVFPGQGSQSLGMLAELGAEHPLVLETFKEASAALGYDLWALVQEGPAEKLNQTILPSLPFSPPRLPCGVCGWLKAASVRTSWLATAWASTARWWLPNA